jgi:hypothetical protein
VATRPLAIRISHPRLSACVARFPSLAARAKLDEAQLALDDRLAYPPLKK